MAEINWNVIEERIAREETTKEEVMRDLISFVNLNIQDCEEKILAAKESPEVYLNKESYKKSLHEYYQNLADLRRGIRIKEIIIL